MTFARFLMLSFFVSGSALASQMPNPLLTHSRSNMTVTPAARTATSCNIYDKETVKRATLGGNPPTTTTVNTAYTAEVKDAAQLRQLVDQAAKGTIKKTSQRGPVGGANEKYHAVQTLGAGGAPKATVLKTSGVDPQEENTSKAAKKLIKFIDFNCKKQ